MASQDPVKAALRAVLLPGFFQAEDSIAAECSALQCIGSRVGGLRTKTLPLASLNLRWAADLAARIPGRQCVVSLIHILYNYNPVSVFSALHGAWGKRRSIMFKAVFMIYVTV